LEALIEQIQVQLEKRDKDKEFKVNIDFRLWLTTASTPDFPQQLLMDGVKITKDPPKGVKDNIL
jgi:dynein heavy chain